MGTRILLGSMVVLAQLLTSSLTHAEEHTYSPAHFGMTQEIFFERLKIPDIESTLIIRCSSPVSSDGSLGEPICFGTEPDTNIARTVAKAITAAAENLTVTPAKIDNAPVMVMFPFSLIFQNIDEGLHAQLVNNHLFNTSTLGLNYSAAQRVLNREVTSSCHTLIPSLGYLFTIGSASISNQGEILDWNLEFEGQADCEREVALSFRRSSFIPAIHEGTTVDSTYTELMVTRGI